MARVDRRGFLRAGGQAVTGVAGILGGAPASWPARELNILTAMNYAPTSDAKLDELGKLAGANVRINHVQSVQMPAKLSSELMARSGHDINMFARVVTNAAKPKEAILGAETEIKRMFDKK